MIKLIGPEMVDEKTNRKVSILNNINSCQKTEIGTLTEYVNQFHSISVK